MPNDANGRVVKASLVKEEKRPNTRQVASLGLLLGTALAAYNLVQSSSLPGPELAVLGCLAVTLDMAAVELPLLGYFSAAPTCLGVLALSRQGRTVLLISLLGLLLRTCCFPAKDGSRPVGRRVDEPSLCRRCCGLKILGDCCPPPSSSNYGDGPGPDCN